MAIPTLKSNHKDLNGFYDNNLTSMLGKYAEKSTGWIMHVDALIIDDNTYKFLCSATNVHTPFIQTAKQLEEEYLKLQGN